jgi:U3 small nucleolar RNA-associated protein 4
MDIHRCSFLDYTPESITSCAFTHESNLNEITPKNFRLAVGRADGSIEIWNPHNSRSKWVLETIVPGSKGSSIEGLVWSSNNDSSSPPRLFSIGGSTFLTEWDLSTGIPLKNYDCDAGVIWSISINSTHDKIALGCDDGSVVVVNINGGPGVIEHETILQRQKYRVLSLCWVESRIILGGCADGRIRCWSYDNNNNDKSNENTNDNSNSGAYNQMKGRLIQTLRIDKAKSEPSLIWCLLYLPKSNQFVSGDSTGSIKIWDLKHLVLQQSFQVHEADVLCLTKDVSGEKFFSAGVDRKIYNFNYTKLSKNNSKWINTSNRLLHGNDVRTMNCYQSKNLDFLVSGGIERIMHINSAVNFQSSVAIKLPINPLIENVIVHKERRLIIMWQRNEIKIWKLRLDHTKKLVSKLTLSDPENITNVDISSNGQYLLVSRLSVVKLFKLTEESENKILIEKSKSDLLSSFGAKQSKFINNEELILVYTSENELLSYKFDQYSLTAPLDDFQEPIEYEVPEEEGNNSSSNFEYLSYYTHIAIDENKSLVALCKYNGIIDILNLKTNKISTLLKLSSIATCISFSSNSTLLAVTLDHKVHEFNVLNDKKNGQVYTNWSMKNSNSMPAQFLSLPGYAFGIFDNLGRFGIYGSNWLCFFDTNYDLPNIKAQPENKKRSRNGSQLLDSPSKSANDSNNTVEENKCFFLTKNYIDILYANKLNESELIVVERHLEDIPNPPAFKLNKYSI